MIPPKTSKRFKELGQSEIVSFFKTITTFIILALILRASVVEAFKIPSGSMIPTLRIGDFILVNKLSYGFRLPFVTNIVYRYDEPKRGDVVVFTRPDDPTTTEDDSDINLIKRVIGLPGETIEVKDSRVYINNMIISESYARWDLGGMPEGNFGPQKIPEGHVVLLGDNRDHSKDSRFWYYPFLDINRVKGRALIIYWSWDSMGRIGTLIR